MLIRGKATSSDKNMNLRYGVLSREASFLAELLGIDGGSHVRAPRSAQVVGGAEAQGGRILHQDLTGEDHGVAGHGGAADQVHRGVVIFAMPLAHLRVYDRKFWDRYVEHLQKKKKISRARCQGVQWTDLVGYECKIRYKAIDGSTREINSLVKRWSMQLSVPT